MQTIHAEVSPVGWWDERHIISINTNASHVFFDVVTQKTNVFRPTALDLQKFQQTQHLGSYEIFQRDKADPSQTYIVTGDPNWRPFPYFTTENDRKNQPQRGGVFLYDITNYTTITIVPPGSDKSYSTPRFYHDKIIYQRNQNEIWQVDMNGSNNLKLFPIAKADH